MMEAAARNTARDFALGVHAAQSAMWLAEQRTPWG
eukprot:gene27355-31117_t